MSLGLRRHRTIFVFFSEMKTIFFFSFTVLFCSESLYQQVEWMEYLDKFSVEHTCLAVLKHMSILQYAS